MTKKEKAKQTNILLTYQQVIGLFRKQTFQKKNRNIIFGHNLPKIIMALYKTITKLLQDQKTNTQDLNVTYAESQHQEKAILNQETPGSRVSCNKFTLNIIFSAKSSLLCLSISSCVADTLSSASSFSAQLIIKEEEKQQRNIRYSLIKH